MTAKTQDVANWFINKGVEEGSPIDPLKLQKLIYLAHGWSLGVRAEPLIKTHFKAWKYGPVLRKLYRRYQSYGMDPIKGTTDEEYKKLSDYITSLLVFTWERYKNFTSVELSNLTHEKHGPWDKTLENITDTYDATIDNELIQEFYNQKYREYYVNG